MENKTYTFTNGVTIINTTPHTITFEDAGELVFVPASGILINAKTVETIVKSGVPTLVKTDFIASEEDEKKLIQIEKEFPGIVPIGSIIAAQAFPGRVFGMTPMPGFERVAPQEKRMNPNKFTTF